jgi:hypothetical protein
MIIKEGFSSSSLLDDLNGGGSIIALNGKQAACSLYYFPLFLNIFSPGYWMDLLNAKIGFDLWYRISRGGKLKLRSAHHCEISFSTN